MPVILGVWSFVMFLWTKIMFETLFWGGITVLAALLIAILFAMYVFVFSGILAKIFLPINLFPGTVETDPFSLFGKSIIPFLIAAIVFGVAVRLVIVGFSEDLSRRLDRFFRWDWEPTEEAWSFALVVFVPCFVHYVLGLAGTFNNRKRVQ